MPAVGVDAVLDNSAGVLDLVVGVVSRLKVRSVLTSLLAAGLILFLHLLLGVPQEQEGLNVSTAAVVGVFGVYQSVEFHDFCLLFIIYSQK